MAQTNLPDKSMDIVPHYPIEKYNVEGFPLSSLEAFILYVNGAEVYSLETDNKTIVGAINELLADINGIDLSPYATWEALEDYATKAELQQVQGEVNALTLIVNQHTTQIADLRTDVDMLIAKLPPDPLTFVLASNTNPRYWAATAKAPVVHSCDVGLTQEGEFIQSVDLTDGILEIMNYTFADNVVLKDYDGNEVDSNNTPHFYIPMTVDYYDSNNNYTGSDHFTLDGTWTREMGAYDLSVYFRGVVTIPSGGRAHYKYSACVPVNTAKKEVAP